MVGRHLWLYKRNTAVEKYCTASNIFLLLKNIATIKKKTMNGQQWNLATEIQLLWTSFRERLLHNGFWQLVMLCGRNETCNAPCWVKKRVEIKLKFLHWRLQSTVNVWVIVSLSYVVKDDPCNIQWVRKPCLFSFLCESCLLPFYVRAVCSFPGHFFILFFF